MKRILVMLLALVPVLGFAYDVEVDGIYYNLVKKAKQATVAWGNNYYSGVAVIPSTITVDGVEYSVTSIEGGAFVGCTSLTSIEIPSSVTGIGWSAFSRCTSLTSIEIPSSVTSIGNSAFYDCSSLTSIEIPSSVKSIGSGAFSGCSSLTSIEIPSSVTSIGIEAFEGCSSLTSIEIPSSVTSIGERAFDTCYSLTSIEIPSSVTSIGDWAFYWCSSLTSIEIPSSVTSIGVWAFRGCSSLETIEIPASVTSIGSGAFAYCEDLADVYYYATELPYLNYYSDQFDGSYVEYATLHVPSAVIDDFKATAPWSSFGKIVPTDDVNIPQCETPVVSFKGGKLKFTCATEGARVHYEIGGTQASSGSVEAIEEEGGEVEVPTYIIVTAYATANGYRRSETTEYQLPFNPGLRGDVNQDGEVTVADAVEVTNIILEKEGELE